MNRIRCVGAATLVLLLICCSSLYGQAPGAVGTNLFIWLKANSGPEEGVGNPAEGGDAITRWLDQSGNNHHYTVVAGPTLVDNALNFNPTVEILNGGFDAPAGAELTSDWTVITLSRKLASDVDGRLFDGHISNYLWSYWGVYTNSLYLIGSPSNHNTGIASTTGLTNLRLHTYTRTNATGALEARADGTMLTTYGTSATAAGVRIDINAGFFPAESSDAHVGEMIVYQRALTAAELLRVESYLAIKYGLTIGHDYVTSAGTTIWNATINAAFNNDIAGIGRDDAGTLDQRKSKAINAASWVTIDKGGAFPNNASYIMWGDNNLSGGSSNIAAPYAMRSARIWKTGVVGTPGTATFSIDLSAAGIPNTGNAADYTLLQDADTDFSSGSTAHTTGASLVGSTLSFTNVNFTHDHYFTVAVSNVNTPGGVAAGLSLWLKADGEVWEAPSDPAESGDAIATWRDMSGFGRHYTSVAGPTLQNSTLNFNPSVEILSGGFDAPAGSELGNEWTTFFVSRKLASDPTGRLFDGHTSNYLWAWWDNYTNSLYLNGSPANHNTGIASTTGLTNLHLHTYKRLASAAVEARADGTSLTTFGSSNAATGIRIDIANGAFSGESSDARVGEMIVYNSALSAGDVTKVESYLGIKYGLTLAQNYTASDGTVIWNYAGNAGFNNDITGIGRDDLSTLNQQKSTTINSTTDITIDKGGAFGTNRSFVLWGNNAGSGVSTNVPATHKIRSGKIWKAAVTGTPGVVTFSINLNAAGLPNTGSPADYALLIDTDTDFSSGAAAHTTGASIVSGVLTFTNVSLSNNSFFTVSAANLSFPGGIPGLAFWVKGDVGTTGSPDVSQWADQSGFGNHAVQSTPANQPSIVTNNINFHTAINFSGGSDMFTMTSPPLNQNSTIFTVGAPAINSSWRTMFRGTANDHPIIVESGAVRLGYYDNDNGGFRPSGFNWTQDEVAVVGLEMRTGDVNFRKNGAQGTSINSISLTGLQLDFFGNYQGTGQQFGRIAETIIYNGPALTAPDKEKIESYLGIKYGVTLTHNYLASDATVTWNVTTNAAYTNNIVGIGRDDNSSLDQRRSVSVNTGAGLTIDKGGAFGSDRNFIVIGNDAGTATTNNIPGAYTLRSGRIWKAAVTGTPGTISVSVDLTSVSIPNTGNAADYALLKDTDTDFSSGTTAHTTGASIVGNTLTFTNVSFANNDLFVFAISNLALPGGVAGGVFWVKSETGIVGATDVSQWTDQSGFGNHAVQATVANQPNQVANSINFRTAVNFGASSEVMTLTNPPNNLNSTIFAVGAPINNTNWRTMFRGASNDHPIIVEYPSQNVGYFDADGGGFINSGFSWTNNEVALVAVEMRNANVNFRKNGSQGATINSINLNAAGLNLFAFGNYQVGAQQFGLVSEAIVFNTASAITTTDKEKIESYLGIKYGITLSHNYLNGAGATVWDRTANTGYNNNITGIGRDDNSGLDQRISLSVHSNAAVTVDKGGAFGATNTFLIFGDDGATGTTTSVPAGLLLRTSRIWKTAVTGTPGAVSVTFNLNSLVLPTSGSASDFVVLVDNDTDFTTGATQHTTGATLVGSNLTFTNLTLTNGSYFTLAASNLVTPGGIIGAVFWTKGDVGVTGTTDVSQWNDLTGNLKHAVQPTVANQPALVTNAVNSHSVIDFTTATDFFSITSPPANLNSMAFIVGTPKVNATWRTFLRSSAGDHQMLVETGGTQVGYYDPDGGAFRPGGFSWLQNETAIVSVELRTSNTNFRKNGAQGAAITTVNHTSQNLTWLGNYSTGNQAAGRIAEAIIFNTPGALSTTDKEKIESYLALKYGITLAHNYVTTAGAVVWDITANAAFTNDVAGIGRDDVTSLDQRVSTSVNTGTVVTMDNGGAFSNNLSYLIWGNNTGAMSSPGVTDLPAGVIARLARQWKLQKAGTIGAVTVRFNLSGVPGSKSATDLRLLVDRNLNGQFNDETVGGGVIGGATNLGGGVFEFTGVTFNNGEQFTIGSVAATTPLPINLSSFTAGLTGTGVNVEWTTASELNNDFFTVEKSSNGSEFFEVGIVKGAGSSTSPNSYSFLDPTPLPGRSYYRLKQTDFDKKIMLSKVVAVNYDPTGIIYPNPATKEVSIDIDSGEQVAAEIVNSLGQRLPLRNTISHGRITWNVETLPRGIYFVTILRNGSLTTQKLVLTD